MHNATFSKRSLCDHYNSGGSWFELVNLEEAVQLCENNECTYPLGFKDDADLLYPRKFSSLVCRKRANNGGVGKPSDLSKHCPQNITRSKSSKLLTLEKDVSKQLSRQLSIVRNATVPSQLDRSFKGVSNTAITYPVHNISILEQVNKNVQEHRNLTEDSKKTAKSWAPYVPAKSLSKNCSVESGWNSAVHVTENSEKTLSNTSCINKDMRDRTSEKPVWNLTSDNENTSKKSSESTSVDLDEYEPSKLGLHSVCRSSDKFPQWLNKDALCWLDVVLCLLVHSSTLQFLSKTKLGMDDSVLLTLLKAYNQAQSLTKKLKLKSKFNRKPKQCVPLADTNTSKSEIRQSMVSNKINLKKENINFQTGAGPQVLVPFMNPSDDSTSDLDCLEIDEYPEVNVIMNNIREKVWSLLQPKLNCERGRSNSPVSALQWVVEDNANMAELLTVSYQSSFSCKNCPYRELVVEEKILPSVSSIKNIGDVITYHQNCPDCKIAGDGNWAFDRIPDVHCVHFVDGIPHINFPKLDIYHHGNHFTVTGVVQYKNNPDHFVVWIRNPTDNYWMECDDLKSLMCEFQPQPPSFSPDQVHIVMWEKVVIDKAGKPNYVQKAHSDVSKSITKRKSANDKGKSLVKSLTEIRHSVNRSCDQTMLKSSLQSDLCQASVNQELLRVSDSSEIETYLFVHSPEKNEEQLQSNGEKANGEKVLVQSALQNGHSVNISCDQTILNSSLQSNSFNKEAKGHSESGECETYLVVTSPGNSQADEQSQATSLQLLSPYKKSPLKAKTEFGKKAEQNSRISFVIQPTTRSKLASISASPVKTFMPQFYTPGGTKAAFSYAMQGNKNTLQSSSGKFVKQSAALSALSHVNKIKSNLSILHLQNKSVPKPKQYNSSSTDLAKGQPSTSPKSICRSTYPSRSSVSQETQPQDSATASDGTDTLNNSASSYLAALKPFLQKFQKVPSPASAIGKQSFAGYTLRGSNGRGLQNSNSTAERPAKTLENRKRKLVSTEKCSLKRSKQTAFKTELGVKESKVQSSQSSQECDVLKNLYGALNLPFPVSSAQS
ncbi:hypothetical protein ScPMuIL_007506 [Solemya velum]